MKLNHLILVICTGILVGFSACKKDPFTEADAIAAQKELITMKYGYELQLKNIEAAIQKAHDDAAIVITNLNIKGASDLEKQKAQQELANYIAKLEADRQDYLKWQTLYDSIAKVKQQQQIDSALYKQGFDVNYLLYAIDQRTNKAVAGAKISVLKWDGSGYYTATSNSEGVFVVKGWHVQDNSLFRVEGPANDAKNVYLNYTASAYAVQDWAEYDNDWPDGQIPLYSYDPTNTATIKGTIYAAKDLTNDKADKAGSGIFVKATSSLYNESPAKADTNVTFLVSTVTNNGEYSLKVPKDISKWYGEYWDLSVASDKGGEINVYQKAYTLGEGSNPYQVLPTLEDSGLVTLAPGSHDWAHGNAYFFKLPAENSSKKYSMTLTDPLGILRYALEDVGQDGVRSPDGTETYDSSLTSFNFSVDGFVLNNGWMQVAPSLDPSYYYTRTQRDFVSDATYKDPNNLNPDSLLYNPLGGDTSSKYFSKREWLALSLNDRTAIIANRLLYGNTTFTPTTKDTPLYGRDTLAVDLVDLTGFFVEEAPELSAIVYNPDNTKSKGKLEAIVLLEDANGGMFNIDAALGGDGHLFTNHDENYKDAETDSEIEVYVNGNKTVNFYFGDYVDGFEIRSNEEDSPYDPSVNGTKDAEDYIWD